MKTTLLVTCFALAAALAACGGAGPSSPQPATSNTKLLAQTAIQAAGATFNGIRSAYTITTSGGNRTIADMGGFETPRTFDASVLEFAFADKSLSFDTAGNVGKVYRLYQAAFNRTPDLAGIGYQLYQLDAGYSMDTVANGLINSAEFNALYGANPSNTAFIQALYANVLHRIPDQAGLDFWTAQLVAGGARSAVLISFSESAENINQVSIAIANGIEFVPYGVPHGTQTAWASAISNGTNYSCAKLSTGAVQCWGQNSFGQLGDGTTTNRSSPVTVLNLDGGVKEVRAGGLFTCALTNASIVKCWGYGYLGQMGNGSITTANSTPVTVNSPIGAAQPSTPVAIAVGSQHACLLTMAGEVYCWGSNQFKQLSNGSSAQYAPVPGAVKGDVVGNKLAGIKSIASGTSHTCVVTTAGGAKCFGDNMYGKLGNGNATAIGYAVDVSTLTTGVASINPGSEHTCALLTSGIVKCWGNNQVYQLGIQSGTSPLIPQPVPNLTGVRMITSGTPYSNTTCGFIQGAAPKCWGANNVGQLGNWTTSTGGLANPTSTDLTTVISIAPGAQHTCALANNGQVVCWGTNNYGQLGNGTTGSTIIAKQNVIGFY